MSKKKIVAAGICTLRRDLDGELQVLLVHRPEYDDWSLPKGKPKPDEDLPVTAVREVLEETGCLVQLGQPLGRETYLVHKGTKVVHWWLGRVLSEVEHRPDHEVDHVAWVSIPQAEFRLTYDDEREVLKRAVAAPETSTLVVVRHGKAMDRKHWSGKDWKRPLSARGRRQAKRLVPLLQAYGVSRAMSSNSTRCVQTLIPFAETDGITIEEMEALSEESHEKNPEGVFELMRRLRDETVVEPWQASAVCGHRPVLPLMRESINAPADAMLTGECQFLHIDAQGLVRAQETVKSAF